MAFNIRRIVTGHNDKGRAIVAMDKVITEKAVYQGRGRRAR